MKFIAKNLISLLISLLLPSMSHSQNTDSQKRDSLLTIIAPGDVFDAQAAFLSNEIARKYHFKYDYTGNLREEDSLPLIGKHNAETDSLLIVINGKDWKKHFEEEYTRSYTRDSILIDFIKGKLNDLLKDDTNRSKYYVFRDSTLNQNLYRLTVVGWYNGKLASLMRALVKYPELRITSIDKSIIYRRFNY
ncbi:MAG: hypothetical protein WC760_11590 [Bacteroidia bacterium]|jgi:hypothetical protein